MVGSPQCIITEPMMDEPTICALICSVENGDADCVPGATCQDIMQNGLGICTHESCQAPSKYIGCDSGTDDPFNAIGLNCDGDETNSIQATNTVFSFNNNSAWRIASGFGTFTDPNAADNQPFDDLLYGARPVWKTDPDTLEPIIGDPLMPSSSFLMMSTGTISAPQNGVVTEAHGSQASNGHNGNNDDGNPPAPMLIQDGSNNGNGGDPFKDCDGMGDCSDTIQKQWELTNDANDSMYMKFDVEVPEGTFGYNFSVVFHSSEWPTYVETIFNDLFIGWQTAEVYTGNTTFLPDPDEMTKGLPMTITALDPYLSTTGFSNNEPQLAGTGFEGNAGSDWIQVKAGVSPLETVQVVFYIADMGDSILATQVIIDNFHWDCDGCNLQILGGCGLQL